MRALLGALSSIEHSIANVSPDLKPEELFDMLATARYTLGALRTTGNSLKTVGQLPPKFRPIDPLSARRV